MKKTFKIFMLFCLTIALVLAIASCDDSMMDSMFETLATTPEETTPEETTPEKPHTWSEWTVVKVATCIESGIKQRYCTECYFAEAAVIEVDTNAHTYNNACDNTCNLCGAKRNVPSHVYDNACDATCNVCGKTRTPSNHVYTNACDKTCDICMSIRDVPDHVYDNDCDASCNVCGYARIVPEHVNQDGRCINCGRPDGTVHFHEYINGKCECGDIFVFENTSIYDCNNDGETDIFFFTPILPERFQGEDAIHVWAGDLQTPSGSYGVVSYQNGTSHWYCQEGKDNYLLYTIEVPACGVYEMAVYMRMKDTKARGAKYIINEGTEYEYTFETSFQIATQDDVEMIRDNNTDISSYMFGIKLHLVGGVNTIKIEEDSNTIKNQLFRDFYFVKIGGEHFIIDGKCEICGFIPVFENASVYDNDNDGNVDTYFFTPILPEKFAAEDAIHVWAGTNESPSGSFNTATVNEIVHWFCYEGNNCYLLYTVEVPVSGTYEMAVHMRMKDSMERGAKYTINEGTDNEYVFETSFRFATNDDAYAARENDYTMSSYMFGIYVELQAGKNTIKIQSSPKSPRSQYFRDFYFVKVEE